MESVIRIQNPENPEHGAMVETVDVKDGKINCLITKPAEDGTEHKHPISFDLLTGKWEAGYYLYWYEVEPETLKRIQLLMGVLPAVETKNE